MYMRQALAQKHWLTHLDWPHNAHLPFRPKASRLPNCPKVQADLLDGGLLEQEAGQLLQTAQVLFCCRLRLDVECCNVPACQLPCKRPRMFQTADLPGKAYLGLQDMQCKQ